MLSEMMDGSLILNGAEFIMHPNSCGSLMPRLRELSVRATENRVSIAMANPPGVNKGNSCAYTPIVWGPNGRARDNTLFVAPEEEEGIFYVGFDIDEIREYRDREDIGKYVSQRHIGLYNMSMPPGTGLKTTSKPVVYLREYRKRRIMLKSVWMPRSTTGSRIRRKKRMKSK